MAIIFLGVHSRVHSVAHLTQLAPAHHGGVLPVVAPVYGGQTHRPDVVIELDLERKRRKN